MAIHEGLRPKTKPTEGTPDTKKRNYVVFPINKNFVMRAGDRLRASEINKEKVVSIKKEFKNKNQEHVLFNEFLEGAA
jgi:23S rRNA A2030 N6-methylase RlmJ